LVDKDEGNAGLPPQMGEVVDLLSWLTAVGWIPAGPVGLPFVLISAIGILLFKFGRKKIKQKLDQKAADAQMQAIFSAAWPRAVERYRQQAGDPEIATLFDTWLTPLDAQQREELRLQLAKEPADPLLAFEQIVSMRLRAKANNSTLARDEVRTNQAASVFLRCLIDVLCEDPSLIILREVQTYLQVREVNRKLDVLLTQHDPLRQPSRFINVTVEHIYNNPAPPKEEHIWLPGATPQWYHFRPELDRPEHANRDLYPMLLRRVTELPTDSSYARRGSYLQLLLAEAGCGKTSILMKLAVDLCQRERSTVLYLWREATRNDDPAALATKVLQIAAHLGVAHHLYVLVDSILLMPNLPTFLTMLTAISQPRAQIVVVGASQLRQRNDPQVDMDAVFRAMPDLGPIDQQANGADPIIYLKPYNDQELGQLVLMLNAYGVLIEKIRKQIPTIVPDARITLKLDMFNIRALREPRQTSSLLTSGKYLAEVVAEELEYLQKLSNPQHFGNEYSEPDDRAPLISIYADVCLFYRLGIAAPKAWLEALTPLDSTQAKLLKRIYSAQPLGPGIEIRDIIVQDGTDLRAKHELDAEEVCKLVFGGKQPRKQGERQYSVEEEKDFNRTVEAQYKRLLDVVPKSCEQQAMLLLLVLLGDQEVVADVERMQLVAKLLADHTTQIAALIAVADARELATGWHHVYEGAGNFDEAIRLATLAIDEHIERRGTTHDVAAAYNNRASIYVAKGKYDLALTDYAEAIKLLPDDPTAYSNRGSTYKPWRPVPAMYIDQPEATSLSFGSDCLIWIHSKNTTATAQVESSSSQAITRRRKELELVVIGEYLTDSQHSKAR